MILFLASTAATFVIFFVMNLVVAARREAQAARWNAHISRAASQVARDLTDR